MNASGTPRLAALFLLALVTGLAGCISTPLPDRSWSTLSTQHFEVIATSDTEGTERLAADLERFRSAAEYIWGRPLPATSRRTRVVAYDGRSTETPFRLPKRESSYLLRDPGGDVIVLRGGEGWTEDARPQLKLELARRIFSSATDRPPPPWMEEGLAQVASTTDVHGSRVNVGILRDDHVRALRNQQWVSIDRLLDTQDLERWSDLERQLFEAQTWAVVHYLKFDTQRLARTADDPLWVYASQLERGTSPAKAAQWALGSGLQRKVWHHVSSRQFESLVLEVGARRPPTRVRVVARHEILEVLGRLSLAIDRDAQARRYFEESLEEAPGRGTALAGLGLALSRLGERDAAIQAVAKSLEADPLNPALLLAAGNVYRAAAAAAETATSREVQLALAEAHYTLGLALAPDDPALYMGIAELGLLSGDTAAAREASDRAQALLSGDQQVQRLAARTALAQGDREAARALAVRALTAARLDPELEAARALLQRIDAQAALH